MVSVVGQLPAGAGVVVERVLSRKEERADIVVPSIRTRRAKRIG